MAYLRSHGTPVAINPFGDVTKTGTETLTNKTLTSPTLTAPALGTVASGNFDTVFPNTSTAVNIGKLRIVTGSNNSSATASPYGPNAQTAATSMHAWYSTMTATYTGFSDTPRVFAGTAENPFHQTASSMGRISASSTATNWYILSPLETQIESTAMQWVAIGTAS